jgi:hypothetical protein
VFPQLALLACSASVPLEEGTSKLCQQRDIGVPPSTFSLLTAVLTSCPCFTIHTTKCCSFSCQRSTLHRAATRSSVQLNWQKRQRQRLFCFSVSTSACARQLLCCLPYCALIGLCVMEPLSPDPPAAERTQLHTSGSSTCHLVLHRVDFMHDFILHW